MNKFTNMLEENITKQILNDTDFEILKQESEDLQSKIDQTINDH